MGVMEVVLIILGVVIFVGSFLIPAGKIRDTEDVNAVTEETIKEMVGREVEEAKSQITDIVDETITYAMEKTERSMDRLTNEKMMAVNEYSDTVLEEINKNHKEVVFMYDMLNDKHENLRTTVNEAVKTASEVKQTVRDAEITAKEAEVKAKEVQKNIKEVLVEPVVEQDIVKEDVQQDDFKPITAPRVEILHYPEEDVVQPIETETIHTPIFTPEPVAAPVSEVEPSPKKSSKKTRASKEVKAVSAMNPEGVALPEIEVTLNAAGRTGGRNSNERILELHKAGKSNMAIAKELGLGLGEVKLVIDLFEGI